MNKITLTYNELKGVISVLPKLRALKTDDIIHSFRLAHYFKLLDSEVNRISLEFHPKFKALEDAHNETFRAEITKYISSLDPTTKVEFDVNMVGKKDRTGRNLDNQAQKQMAKFLQAHPEMIQVSNELSLLQNDKLNEICQEMVELPKGLDYELIKCAKELTPSDIGFLIPVLVKLPDEE